MCRDLDFLSALLIQQVQPLLFKHVHMLAKVTTDSCFFLFLSAERQEEAGILKNMHLVNVGEKFDESHLQQTTPSCQLHHST